jgi:hypothetical protein
MPLPRYDTVLRLRPPCPLSLRLLIVIVVDCCCCSFSPVLCPRVCLEPPCAEKPSKSNNTGRREGRKAEAIKSGRNPPAWRNPWGISTRPSGYSRSAIITTRIQNTSPPLTATSNDFLHRPHDSFLAPQLHTQQSTQNKHFIRSFSIRILRL